ncbi:MAG: hypothetical protein J7513_10205 [Solirubrobacteraceae bacterium]|nr:hypothetical protein [Solirubrobacteraceae bacterium]
MTTPATPGEPVASGDDANMTEILARFARSASQEAPTGTIQLAGHAPVEFAGWLDLMARVEEILAADAEGRVP